MQAATVKKFREMSTNAPLHLINNQLFVMLPTAACRILTLDYIRILGWIFF